MAWYWSNILLFNPKILLDGFFYIPMAGLSSLISIYIGLYYLCKRVKKGWLLIVRSTIKRGIDINLIGFWLSWNSHYMVMTTEVWLIGNLAVMVMAMILKGRSPFKWAWVHSTHSYIPTPTLPKGEGERD